MKAARALVVCAVALVLTACNTTPQRPGEVELAAGIRTYGEGRFADSLQYLQRSLDLGLGDADRVRAHKYRAFIQCALGREAQCREEFRAALAINPSLELDPAEAGHPKWGPVFRSVKERR